MNYRILFLVFAGFLVISLAFADVPKLINFQGRLTDSSGKFVTDGDYSLTFRIYSDSTGGTAKWTESQTVSVSEGLFNATLGSDTPIPDSIFNYVDVWLGVQIEADPEMTPRQRLSSLGYSYRTAKADTSSYSMDSDKLDGYDATDFTSTGTDYGRVGVATDLFEGTITLTDKYVNTQGPDSVYCTYGTAFTAKTSASSDSSVIGIQGYADNTLSGDSYGGFFSTSYSGTGENVGIRGEGYGSFAFSTVGCYGYADNTSDGSAWGGVFETSSSGIGTHLGIAAAGLSSSSGTTYGVYGYAENSSTGNAYGAFFETSAYGTGMHMGMAATAYGSSTHTIYGSTGYAQNSSSGDSRGCQGFATNTSSGNAYGGYFYTTSSGTGTKYGVYAYTDTAVGYAAFFDGDMTVVTGSKSAAVKVNNGEYRMLYCQESPENWFEDFGEGQLINGKTHIELDDLFIETVTINNQYPMKVFIQLTSGEPMNVVVNKGATGFDIRAQDIASNATFDYRVVAKRRGYEHIRLSKMGGPTPEQVAAEQVKHRAEFDKERAEMEAERLKIKTEKYH